MDPLTAENTCILVRVAPDGMAETQFMSQFGDIRKKLKILDKDWVLEARQETADTIIKIVNDQLKSEKIDAKFKVRKLTNKGVEVSAVIGNRMIGEDETSEEDEDGRAVEERD